MVLLKWFRGTGTLETCTCRLMSAHVGLADVGTDVGCAQADIGPEVKAII